MDLNNRKMINHPPSPAIIYKFLIIEFENNYFENTLFNTRIHIFKFVFENFEIISLLTSVVQKLLLHKLIK